MKMSCCQWGHSNEIKASWCMGKIEVVQFCTVLYYALCCVPVRPKPDQGGLKWEVLKETRSREKIQHQLHLRQCCLPGGSWGRGACYTEKLSLKDSAQEEDVSGGCCFGSVGEQGHKSALASGTKTVEMACWITSLVSQAKICLGEIPGQARRTDQG